MKGLKLQSKKKPTRIEIINNYISSANMVINTAQNAINNPTAKNFEVAEHTYGVWVLDIHKFLNDFDEKKAQLFISDLDGVRAHLLNSLEERSGNVIPQVGFFKEEDGVIYADESGTRMLQNIISSVKGKVISLDRLKLEITGGILSDKDSKRVTIIFYESGKIRTTIDDQEMKKRRGSLIFKIIEKIRESKGTKLVTLENELRSEGTNISVAISNFNDDVMLKWSLKKKIIENYGAGYLMNKDEYGFYYKEC